MERKKFVSLLGFSAGMVFLAPVAASCSKDSESAPGENNNNNNNNGSGSVDFTLDLSTPTYAVLNSNGGSVIKDSIIIARTSAGVYVALSSICTHQGSTIGFESGSNRFHCPNHGSNFTVDGAVINGPATTALKKYNTQLNGTSLRIYS